MSSELSIIQNNSGALSIWEGESLKQIKEIYAKALSGSEFIVFMEMGKAMRLNPFLREIWAVKYGNNAASIFIGRDGYRKNAQSHPNYDYHLADAVYSNDHFEVTNGIVNHKYNLKDRGQLLGAYCIVKRKTSSNVIYTFVELAEYDLNQGVWKQKKSTMIKKVAESQCLRSAFQELFAGTYDESEQFEAISNEPRQNNAQSKVMDLLNAKQSSNGRSGNGYSNGASFEENVVEAEIVQGNSQATSSNRSYEVASQSEQESFSSDGASTNGPSTPEQIEALENLAHERGFSPLRMRKALNHYKVGVLSELNYDQADEFIGILGKEPIAEQE